MKTLRSEVRQSALGTLGDFPMLTELVRNREVAKHCFRAFFSLKIAHYSTWILEKADRLYCESISVLCN